MISSEILSWPVAAVLCTAIFVLMMFLAPQKSLDIRENMVDKSIDVRGKTAVISGLKAGKESKTNYERISLKLSGKDTEIISEKIEESGQGFSHFALNVNPEDGEKLSFGDQGVPTGRESYGSVNYKMPLRGGKIAEISANYEVIT